MDALDAAVDDGADVAAEMVHDAVERA